MSVEKVIALTGKLLQLYKRWQELEKRRKDLDYDFSVWARELRAQFENDLQCAKWLETELNLTEPRIREVLLRAATAKVVTDEKTWKSLGGYSKIRSVELLPKREQVMAIQEAKASGLQVHSVVRKRLAVNDPPQKASPARLKLQPLVDAEMLAKFIARSVPSSKLPPEIRNILLRYVSAREARAQSTAAQSMSLS